MSVWVCPFVSPQSSTTPSFRRSSINNKSKWKSDRECDPGRHEKKKSQQAQRRGKEKEKAMRDTPPARFSSGLGGTASGQRDTIYSGGEEPVALASLRDRCMLASRFAWIRSLMSSYGPVKKERATTLARRNAGPITTRPATAAGNASTASSAAAGRPQSAACAAASSAASKPTGEASRSQGFMFNKAFGQHILKVRGQACRGAWPTPSR